jgi:hypothetical protein
MNYTREELYHKSIVQLCALFGINQSAKGFIGAFNRRFKIWSYYRYKTEGSKRVHVFRAGIRSDHINSIR